MCEQIRGRREFHPPVCGTRSRGHPARSPGNGNGNGECGCPTRWRSGLDPPRADRHLGQPARGGAERRPGRRGVDPGLLGRPIRDLPGRHGPATCGESWRARSRASSIQNFRIAAGLAEGRHRGPPWNDGDFYKWLEAAAAVYAVTKDDGARPADGRGDRRHRPGPARRRLPPHAGPDQAPQRRPRRASRSRTASTSRPTTSGHLMTAACVHHRATGKTTLLQVAIKAADYPGRRSSGRRRRELARNAVCPVALHGGRRALPHHARPAIPGAGPHADRPPRPGRGRHRRQPGPHPVPPADPRPSATPSGPTTSTPARPTCTPRRATGPCSDPC